jgi:hypothetical protein
MIRAIVIAMRALVLVTLVGCSFDPQALGVDASSGTAGGDASGATTDAPHTGSGSNGSGSGSGSGGGSAAPCYAPDQSQLALCLELDDADLVSNKTDATALDGSPGHHDAMVLGSQVTTRDVPATSQAETLLTSEESVPTTILPEDSTDFDLQQLTLMMWVEPTSQPATGVTWGLLEKANQYLIGLDDDGNVFCEVENTDGVIATSVGDSVPVNAWSLVACTYSGADLCTLVLPDGSGDTAQLRCESSSSNPTLATGSGNALVVGSRINAAGTYDHVVGAVDSVRIFGRVLSQVDICTGGGRTNC